MVDVQPCLSALSVAGKVDRGTRSTKVDQGTVVSLFVFRRQQLFGGDQYLTTYISQVVNSEKRLCGRSLFVENGYLLYLRKQVLTASRHGDFQVYLLFFHIAFGSQRLVLLVGRDGILKQVIEVISPPEVVITLIVYIGFTHGKLQVLNGFLFLFGIAVKGRSSILVIENGVGRVEAEQLRIKRHRFCK